MKIKIHKALSENDDLRLFLGGLSCVSKIERIDVQIGEPFVPQRDEMLCSIRIKFKKNVSRYIQELILDTFKDKLAEVANPCGHGHSYGFVGDEFVISIPYNSENAALYFHN